MQRFDMSRSSGLPVPCSGPAFVPWGRTVALLLAISCLGLTIGVLVYLTDRVSTHAILIPPVDYLSGRHLFGPIGPWLPSFIHPFAFSLLTAAALPPSTIARYLACVAWFGVDVAFELGQYPRFSGSLATAIQDAFGSNPVTRSLANYFLRGTFDCGDLLASALGGLAAAVVLCVVQRQIESSHEQ